MDSDKQTNKVKHRNNIPNNVDDSNVLQPVRIRHSFLLNNEINRFILDYHVSFLPGISMLFWYIFLLT